MENAKNVVALIFSKICMLLYSFAVIVVIAHFRDNDFMGKYALVMTWILIFKVIASLGIGEFISREIGKDLKESSNLVLHGLGIGLFSSIVSIGVLWLSTIVLNYPQDLKLAIFIGGWAVIPLTLSSICEGGFIAHKQVVYIAYISIIENIVTTILSVWLVLTGYGLIPIIVVFVIIRTLSFFACILIFHYRIYRLRFDIHLSYFFRLIPSIYVFGAITILSAIFLKIDILMLSKLKDTASVAIYTAASKILDASLLVPLAFVFIFLPVLSKEFSARNILLVKELLLNITRVVHIIVVPISIGIAYFAKPVVILLYGKQYLGSIFVLQILMLALMIFSMDMILGLLCKACGFQRVDLLILVVNTVINIILNFALIPPLGYVGACLATVISIFISLCLHYLFVTRKLIELSGFVKSFWKPFVATAIPLLLLHPLDSNLHLIIHAVLFIIGYCGVLVLLRGVTVEEIKSVLKIGIPLRQILKQKNEGAEFK